MPLIREILGLDCQLFILLNNHLHCGVLDAVMPFITNLDNWRLPILLVLLGLIAFGGSRGRWAALFVVLSLAIGDQLANHWLKPFFARTRPCHVVESLRLLVSCSGSFSFPSSHATNIAASMSVLAYFYRHVRPLFAFIAVLVGYSRIYVGVHYPLDVLGGFVLGAFVALVLIVVWRGVVFRWGKTWKLET